MFKYKFNQYNKRAMTTHADLLNAVAAVEKKDGVIGFPTDTVYGLGCKVDHPEAKIYVDLS